jgi:hypothetical protein
MLDAEGLEGVIDQITAIFTNEAEAGKFNEDPEAYVDEHLPEGTEGADVAAALPTVAERTGLDFSNVASTGGGASAAGQLSHTYETIYQQNTYIYAEEGSQVTNIQGNDNAVAQQDIDVDIDVEYGEGETETEEPPVLEEMPEETPIEMETPEAPAPDAPAEEGPIDYGGVAGPGEPEQPGLVGEDLPEPEPAPEPEPEPEPAPEPMDGMDV